MRALRILVVFVSAFSLVSLPSVLSSNFHLPGIPAVRAQQETTAGSWYPAGAQEQTLSISEGNGASGTQVGWLITNQVDAEDWPLTATQQGTGTGNVNCAGNTAVFCSLPMPDHGYFEIEFNLATILWGIPFQYGNSAAGVELRQGIAHLLNKQSFTTNNAACLSIACVPNDQAIPVCTTTAGCTNGGLPAANPCSWDTKYSESSSTNCVVGAPGGTAYNCNFSITCPTGTATGTTTFPWQAQIGSADFCAAAQHFITAFADAGITGVTTNTNCELVAPTGGWPSAVTAVNRSCVFPHANVCMPVRTTEPRKGLGEGIAQGICALFSPAWGAWTTIAGKPFSCDDTNTGSGNSACGGGPCPFLQELEGDVSITFGCVFTTSTNGTPSNCWGLGTFGFGQVFPFDSTTYFEYNSLFATKTTVTCTSADCSSHVPGSPCASTVFTDGASDYNYVCSPTYDSLSSAMEFSSCLSATGDPTPNAATPTFVNCSGGTSGSGTGSTSCISVSCTAISAGYQAEDYYGSHVFTIPVWSGSDSQGRFSNWAPGGSSPGFITAFGGGYSASANLFEWLNAYSATPAVAGTFRQSFLTTVSNLNPFDFTTLWEGYLLSNIYDTLFNQNPECPYLPSLAAAEGVPQCSSLLQNIDWMTTSHSFLCYTGGPACTSTTLGYGNSTYFAGTTADLRLTLNRNNHWQDGGPLTAWDVKYSFMNLNATGAYQATSALPGIFPFPFGPAALPSIAHINVLDEFTLDLNLKAKGPFTEFLIGGITIIPGHVWSACGGSTWNSGVAGKNIAGSNIVSAAEDTCVGNFASPSISSTCLVSGVATRCDQPTVDVMANNLLIGSGPYTCQSIGGTGHPAMGTLGGGCSVDNTMSPVSGLNDFTLTRTGCTLSSTGTTCGVAGSSSDYFRSSGSLASYIWTGDIGSGSADFSKVLTVNSCHSATPSANCPHWAQGIGNPSLTSTSNPVGLSQRLKVNSLKGISWIGFSTEKTTSTQLILSCSAGYTIPGTTITPCNTTNAGWTTTVLPGLGVYAATLYEVGSQITIGTTTTATSTLAPAASIGCASDYPTGGYDC